MPSNSFVRTGQSVEGVGIGHGIGLCQRGAAAIAVEGADYQHILDYFYPNTEITHAKMHLP